MPLSFAPGPRTGPTGEVLHLFGAGLTLELPFSRRAALAVKERTDQARKLDAGLFRGTALAPMETTLGSLGVEAIIVGGCCELNTTAHRLIIDIGAQLGIRAATASGEDANQCVALETTRVRRDGPLVPPSQIGSGHLRWGCRVG